MRAAKKPPIAVLLLPRALEQFILREQAEDLLQAPGVVAVEPGRLPYGVFGRVPERTARRLAARQARRLLRGLPGRPAAVVLFHPLQWPLARELSGRVEGCEVWYGRWDRFERAYDAGDALRARLAALPGSGAGKESAASPTSCASRPASSSSSASLPETTNVSDERSAACSCSAASRTRIAGEAS